MPSTGQTPITLFNSTTTGHVPTTGGGTINQGELAINITDGKLFLGTGSNAYVTLLSSFKTSAAAPTIASATTIAPTTAFAFVSGTTAIATITPPVQVSSSGGQITLIPTGVFTTTTGGNIALASTAVVNKALIMTYDSGTSKWYPSY